MAATAQLIFQLSVSDGAGGVNQFTPLNTTWVVGTAGLGQRGPVSLSGSATTQLTVPSGAKGMYIKLNGITSGLTLKGASGDTGVALGGAFDEFVIPVSNPTVYIANSGSTAVIEVGWL